MSSVEEGGSQGVAIIGMAGRFPGARDVAEFWRNLRDGVEAISFFTEEELIASGVSPAQARNPNYVGAKGVLEGAEMFDAAFFGYNPREAEILDPQQRVFLECAWAALEAAGYGSERRPASVGLFAGASSSTYLWNLLTNPALLEDVGFFQIMLGNDRDYVATRVSYEMNLRGPSVNVQTGCSTSLVAVHLACQSLLDYHCDVALAGGVSITLPLKGGYLYQAGSIASPDGHCRAFDERAQGTVHGNGVGVVVLKRLEDAVADGDHIRAVIRGSAINNDGSGKIGFTAPSVEGQAQVIQEAQAVSGISPETVGYVEAHGTATPLGDPIEAAALAQAFRPAAGRRGSCALASVKTNVGHLDAAAGVVGLIKATLAVEHGVIPPSLHFERPNPRCDFEGTPFYVPSEAREWERAEGHGPRRAGVSSFGIGGTNAHVVIEEAPALGPSQPARLPAQLLAVSAKTEAALEESARRLSRHLTDHSGEGDAADGAWLADVAYTLQVGRAEMGERLAVVCRSAREAAGALAATAGEPEAGASGAARLVRGRAAGPPPRVVMLFPGQGSHYAGMCRELYEALPEFRRHFDACADAVRAAGGPDARAVVTRGHIEEEMRRTAVAQPVLWATEVALARVWEGWGVKPWGVAGHSLGELSAAVCAGVLGIEDGARLVVRRGELMGAAGEGGSMIAVNLPERETRSLLGARRVQLAAVNAPRQCVLAGPREAVAELAEELTREGVDWRDLGTAYAFHSELMDPAVGPLVEEARRARLGDPRLPMISGVTGRWAEPGEVSRAEYWGRQLREPVRFSAGVEEILKELGGGGVLLEVGPGRTLCSLAQRHLTGDAKRRVSVQPSLFRRGEGDTEVASMLEALARLWAEGAGVEWGALYADERRRRVPLPTYPFERQRYWIDARPLEHLARAGAGSLKKKEEIADWFYVPVWKQSATDPRRARGAAPTDSQDRPRNCLVFTDECGLGARLREGLEAEGWVVTEVHPGGDFRGLGDDAYAIDPARRESYDALVKDLLARGRRPDTILHLWGVTAEESSSSADWFERSQRQGFYSLLHLAQALGEHVLPAVPDGSVGERARLFVVSNRLHSVTGDERVEPEKATLLGPCRVIPQEYEGLACRGVDVALPPDEESWRQLLEQLRAEFAAASDETVIAYRGGRRWVQAFDAVRLEGRAAANDDEGRAASVAPDGEGAAARQELSVPARLRERGVYLITGGGGGVGMELAAYLARAYRARLVLLGRGEPGAERLAELERSGGEVMWVRADVSDEGAVGEALEEARRRFGPINGLIHAAGVPGGGFIQLMKPEVAEATMAPKVKGTRVLQKVLAGEPLDFVVLFSSLRSLLGGHGRVDYCAANAFLDAFARASADGAAPFTCSIIWDGWQEVGMAVEAARRFNHEPEDGMLTREGLEAFARALDGAWPEVVVSMRDFAEVVAQSESLTAASELARITEERPAQAAHARPNIDTPYVAPRTEAERVIADIWQQLLGIESVGVNDNFFELGGDSVLSIQIIAKTNKVGLRLTPQQLFEHQTVAALAAAAGTGEAVEVRQEAVTGDVPLTPAQRWFAELDPPDPHHWNQSLLLETRRPLDAHLLERAVVNLLEHHDALRMRFVQGETGWRQYNATPGGATPFAHHDLSTLPEDEQATALEAAAAEAQTSLDLAVGPLLRVALFDMGTGRPGRLLVIAHHLVVDAIAWRFLLEDLATAYEQAGRGEAVSLPAKTTSFKDWAERLERHAQTDEVAAELDYWLADERLGVEPLPTDLEEGRSANTEGSAQTLRVALEAEETRALLQDVPHVYHTQINDALLTALGLAFRQWTGRDLLLVDLEGHGREAVFNDADVTRTAGWFTTIYPVLVEVGAGSGAGEALKRVKEQLRRVPGRGFGYGLLRYMRRDEGMRGRLRQMPRAEVSFLYLGQLDEALPQSSPFAPADESRGPVCSPRAERSHLLMVSGFVAGGRLQFDWTYGVNVHSPSTVERLAESFLGCLRDIVAHCSEAEAGGFTPSDFPDAELSQEDLDQLLQGLVRAGD